MKILVVCQYYYPENFSITSLCEEWVRLGHEVFVVTGKYHNGVAGFDMKLFPCLHLTM